MERVVKVIKVRLLEMVLMGKRWQKHTRVGHAYFVRGLSSILVLSPASLFCHHQDGIVNQKCKGQGQTAVARAAINTVSRQIDWL